MRLLLALFCAGLLSGAAAHAQIGGSRAFSFLGLAPNAWQSAVGGNPVAGHAQHDFWAHNPALLAQAQPYTFTADRLFYFADAALNTFTVALPHPAPAGQDAAAPRAAGTWGLDVRALNYGTFNGTTPAGLPNGTFDAADLALGVAYARSAGPFSIGATLRYAQSRLDAFSQNGLMLDLGGVFVHPTADLRVAMVMRNMGTTWVNNAAVEAGATPFDVNLGLNFKPQYMPFRFLLTAQHLVRSNLAQETLFSTSLDGQTENPGLGAQVLSRLSFGLQLEPAKSVHILAGYNYMRNRELQLQQAGGGAGLTWGFAIQTRWLGLYFSQAFYHVSGGYTHAGLRIDTQKIFSFGGA